TRAKRARKTAGTESEGMEAYREVLERFGPSEFTGYQEGESKGRVLAVVGDEVFLDRTPFYAEAGGQVGDTGTITTDTGVVEVVDTSYALPGLHRHTVRPLEGDVVAGQEATASVVADRRSSIRRNHTGTHILHWALREVLGPHVKQAGSLVAPDRFRFDFSHYEGVGDD